MSSSLRTHGRMNERDLGTMPGSRFFVVLLVLLLGACSISERPTDASDAATAETLDVSGAEAMLHASAASWNAGDLDGFVDDYSDDPLLAFVGAGGVTRGAAEVRANYESGYWATGAAADSLRFEDLEIRPLGEAHAFALGRYVLYQPQVAGQDSITSTGWFSLVLGFEGGRWRILHDHTSELELDPELVGEARP